MEIWKNKTIEWMKNINIDELLEEYTFNLDIFTDIDDKLLDIYPK